VVITTLGLPRTPEVAAKTLEEGARKWLEPAWKL
jgi:hypothetical protein